MKKTRIITRYSSQHQIPATGLGPPEKNVSDKGVEFPLNEKNHNPGSVGPEKAIEAREDEAVKRSEAAILMALDESEFEALFGVPRNPPPLWKQGPFVVAMLCNLAVIIAICSVIFMFLRR